MKFGYFNEKEREYVITDPRTPVKWINYIGTRDFGGFVDHTGGALICKDDPTYNRITKYIQQMPSSDFKGETLYLRLHLPDGYRVFSPFFVPTLDDYDSFNCHVGLGYMRLVTEFYGVRIDATIFVPPGAFCEVRDIKITNISKQPLTLDAVPLVEYTHPDAMMQYTNADWVPQTMQGKYLPDGDLAILLQYPFMNRDRQMNYLTSNLPASSYETDRKVFLGDNEYGSFRAPLSLLNPELGNSEALRGDNIAALLHPLGTLQPGETRRLITQLGQAPDIDSARDSITRYRQPENVDAALGEMAAFWHDYLSTLQVDTPDENMNLMLNLFNPYQCYVTKTWSRYLSYYQLGLGSRGIGMRDSSQDILAVVATLPQQSREFISTLLSFQKSDGSAMHQFNPLTLEGSEGDSLEREDRPHYYSDDHLWGVLAVTAYLKETGDLPFLEQDIPFYDKDKKGDPLETGTVLEHLARSLAFTRGNVGAHGLPLLGFADWNDTVNLPPGAESLFTANLYGRALLEMIALMQHLGNVKAAQNYQEAYQEMKERVESAAWDGEWYVRYFDEQGDPVGSAKNEYGKISLNGQTWPVISGFASPERARQAMDAVYDELNTRCGIKVSTPGFDGYDPRYGGVTTFPPGAKENGGIFLHPNPWAMIAEAMLGDGDRAFQYYDQINPAAKNDEAEVYEIEPFVYAQNILADTHPQFGLGRNSWLSGTASWCYQAGTQWILGIRPAYDGLQIAPVIPSTWKGFTVKRKYRGILFNIDVVRAGPGNQATIKVDGSAIEGNIIPISDNFGSEVKVTVTLE